MPKLVGSSRRRPPLHPLDSALKGTPFVILPSASGGALIGCWGPDSTFLDSKTGIPPEAANRYGLGDIQLSSHPNVIVRTKPKDGTGKRISRILLFEPDGMKLLLSNPQRDGDQSAKFCYPAAMDDFAARGFAVAWDGSKLGILAWSSKGSPWGATAAKLFVITEDGHAEFDVVFPFAETMINRLKAAHRDPKTFQFPHPDPKGLIATPQGYVITGLAMEGFWFLPAH